VAGVETHRGVRRGQVGKQPGKLGRVAPDAVVGRQVLEGVGHADSLAAFAQFGHGSSQAVKLHPVLTRRCWRELPRRAVYDDERAAELEHEPALGAVGLDGELPRGLVGARRVVLRPEQAVDAVARQAALGEVILHLPDRDSGILAAIGLHDGAAELPEAFQPLSWRKFVEPDWRHSA